VVTSDEVEQELLRIGFTVSCFPHKIKGASAGWTRAVAILDD
jgi:kynurenine formamidase